MAERRMIHRKITRNKKLAKLKNPWAKLFYTWLIPFNDDFGCYTGDIELLKMDIFPREPSQGEQEILQILKDLEEEDLIKAHVDKEKEVYIKCLGFDSTQTFKSDRKRKRLYGETNDEQLLLSQWNPMESNGIQKDNKEVKLRKEGRKEDKEINKTKKEKDPVRVIDYFNANGNSKYTLKPFLTMIENILKDNSLEDICLTIDFLYATKTPETEKYFTPLTVFRPKNFPIRLEQARQWKQKQAKHKEREKPKIDMDKENPSEQDKTEVRKMIQDLANDKKMPE